MYNNKRNVKSAKERLGFDNGSIIIFKGNTYPYLNWFKSAGAKYNPIWGWAFKSYEDVPNPIPEDLEMFELKWEDVSIENIWLKDEEDIKKVVNDLFYPEDEADGEYVGEVGEKIQVYLTVIKTINLDGFYGPSTMFVMLDDLNNTYVWTTTSNVGLNVDQTYNIRGTIKDLRIYKGQRQNILSRCRVL